MNQKTKMIDVVQEGDRLSELLKTGAQIPLLVTGSSMLPLLHDGRDTVWLQSPHGALHRGQILFFRRSDGSFVLHRLRRIRRDGILLANGDAQNWCEPVHPSQVEAVVTALRRNGKLFEADSFRLRLWALLWYPTRPVRPYLFRAYGRFRRYFPRRPN